MAIKHIDEKRCKICKAIFPDESDMIDDVYINRKDEEFHNQFLGTFCEFCRPPSAYIHPKQLIYVVDRHG